MPVQKGGVRRSVLLCAVGLSAAAALTACRSGSGDGASSGTPATPSPSAVVTVDVTPADGARAVRLDAPVTVRSNGPPLDTVSVSGPAGHPLAGSFTADRTSWVSSAPLAPAARYQVAARTAPGPGGTRAAASRTSAFTTLTPATSLKVSWEPVDGQVVGIGAPVTMQFTAPVPDRTAVQRRLLVRTRPAVDGAWHWFSDQEVRWRPPSYWQPGTKVHVEAKLAGYDGGNGLWGVKDRAMDFRVGDRRISHVDGQRHMMTVTRNGKVVRVIPVSLGRDQYPTMEGPHNVIETSPLVIMDSATVGIPQGSARYYREKVLWNVKFTSGGEYVHAAPWSVGSQGRVNVSHGCVNASPADAGWFFGFSRVGDIVQVTGTGRPPDTSQAGNDWSIGWNTWRSGDALAGPSRAR